MAKDATALISTAEPAKEVGDQRHSAGHHKGDEGSQGGIERSALIQKQTEVLHHHGIHPLFLPAGLDSHQLSRVFIAVSLPPVDLHELCALTLGKVLHLPGLALTFASIVLALAL